MYVYIAQPRQVAVIVYVYNHYRRDNSVSQNSNMLKLKTKTIEKIHSRLDYKVCNYVGHSASKRKAMMTSSSDSQAVVKYCDMLERFPKTRAHYSLQHTYTCVCTYVCNGLSHPGIRLSCQLVHGYIQRNLIAHTFSCTQSWCIVSRWFDNVNDARHAVLVAISDDGHITRNR
jgi:hypothetical protein